MAIGLWARLEKEEIAAFDSFTLDPAYFLVAVGAVMFVTSVFGCVGALRENICLLKGVRSLQCSLKLCVIFIQEKKKLIHVCIISNSRGHRRNDKKR